MIELTPRAQAEIAQLCEQDPENKSFRIFIDHKGCEGLSFAFGMDNPIDQDSCLIEDDAVVLISTRLARLVRGAVLDFGDEPVFPEAQSGCSPAPVDRTDPLSVYFRRFTLTLPNEQQFRGKFYKHSTASVLHWDTV